MVIAKQTLIQQSLADVPGLEKLPDGWPGRIRHAPFRACPLVQVRFVATTPSLVFSPGEPGGGRKERAEAAASAEPIPS